MDRGLGGAPTGLSNKHRLPAWSENWFTCNPTRTVRYKRTLLELLGKSSWGLSSTECGSVKTCSLLGSKKKSTMRMNALPQRKAQMRHTEKTNLDDIVSNTGSNHS